MSSIIINKNKKFLLQIKQYRKYVINSISSKTSITNAAAAAASLTATNSPSTTAGTINTKDILLKTPGTITKRSIAINDEEYSKSPNYPEIKDLHFRAKKKDRDGVWYNEVKKCNTIEEKQIKINMPKYYGFKTAILKDDQFNYNCLPFFQNCTRTWLINDSSDGGNKDSSQTSLPEFYQNNQSSADALLKSIKHDIEDAILFEMIGYDHKLPDGDLSKDELNRLKSSKIVRQIHRIIVNALLADVPHLKECELDLNPRHEAFWCVGGITPPKIVRRYRYEKPWLRPTLFDPVDRMFQYIGTPMLAVRHQDPLQPIVDYTQYPLEEIFEKVPKIKYDPRAFGYTHEFRHGTNIPGFWPGNEYEFGLLSYHSRHHMIDRNPIYGQEDNCNALHAQGILCSYGWLLAQAYYQGFTTYNDITYPLVTQTIITDGQYWSFYVYQMNTILMHINAYDTNQQMNQCWAGKEQKLYESIDYENGKIIGGLNEQVLKQLIQFYINKPLERQYEMRPYLNQDESKISDISNEERRTFLETRFKHMASNRPRHRLLPELYHWEKIYKIDHEGRPLDARRRFFELNQNPFRRRMNEHTPEYVPKALRKMGRKDPKRWANTYWP